MCYWRVKYYGAKKLDYYAEPLYHPNHYSKFFKDGASVHGCALGPVPPA